MYVLTWGSCRIYHVFPYLGIISYLPCITLPGHHAVFTMYLIIFLGGGGSCRIYHVFHYLGIDHVVFTMYFITWGSCRINLPCISLPGVHVVFTMYFLTWGSCRIYHVFHYLRVMPYLPCISLPGGHVLFTMCFITWGSCRSYDVFHYLRVIPYLPCISLSGGHIVITMYFLPGDHVLFIIETTQQEKGRHIYVFSVGHVAPDKWNWINGFVSG